MRHMGDAAGEGGSGADDRDDDDDDYDGGYDGDDYDDFVAYVNGNAYGFGNGNGNAYGFGNGNGNGNDDDRGGGFGNFIADFLANNQTEVLAVTSMIPTFYLGPVAVGNSLLATAYYNGYNGSAAGVDGVISYVTSQIGVPPAEIVQSLVLSVTSLVPQFNIGPVPVGNALLATAYFDGYNGSGTGLPGVISYVTSQLGIQAAPAAVTVNAVAAPVAVSATDSAPAVASVAAQDSDAEAGTDDVRAVKAVDKVVATTVSPAGADADRPGSAAPVSAPAAENTRRAGRASGQLPTTAKAGDAGGQSKARSVRSAAKSGAGES